MDDNRRNGSIRSNNKTRIAKLRTSVGSLARSVNDDDTPLKQQQQQQQPRSNSDEQWDASNDGRMDFVTEQVYIHSKLMIVDDKTVICGSGKKIRKKSIDRSVTVLSGPISQSQ
jgi:phosphatidylserine/phosphatidylglycerophosphate/cardiolipin synthase-like enzyme